MIDTMQCRATNFCDADAEAAAGAHAFLDRRLYPLIERDEEVRVKLDPCFVVFDFAAFNHTPPRTLQDLCTLVEFLTMLLPVQLVGTNRWPWSLLKSIRKPITTCRSCSPCTGLEMRVLTTRDTLAGS